MDFLGDGAAEVVERFADVVGVVVGFVVVGRAVLLSIEVPGGSGELPTYVTCKSFW